MPGYLSTTRGLPDCISPEPEERGPRLPPSFLTGPEGYQSFPTHQYLRLYSLDLEHLLIHWYGQMRYKLVQRRRLSKDTLADKKWKITIPLNLLITFNKIQYVIISNDKFNSSSVEAQIFNLGLWKVLRSNLALDLIGLWWDKRERKSKVGRSLVTSNDDIKEIM